MKTQIHIDIDGTFLDSHRSWLKNNKIGFSVFDITDWNMDKCLYDGATKSFIKFIENNDCEMFEYLEYRGRSTCYFNSEKVVDNLMKKYKTFFVTSRNQTCINRFKRQFPKYSDVVFSKERMKELFIDYSDNIIYIDDYPDPFYVNNIAKYTVVITRPWNENLFFPFIHDRIRGLNELEPEKYTWYNVIEVDINE